MEPSGVDAGRLDSWLLLIVTIRTCQKNLFLRQNNMASFTWLVGSSLEAVGLTKGSQPALTPTRNPSPSSNKHPRSPSRAPWCSARCPSCRSSSRRGCAAPGHRGRTSPGRSPPRRSSPSTDVPPPAFGSGRDDGFAAGPSGLRCAVWVDFPEAEGGEEKAGRLGLVGRFFLRNGTGNPNREQIFPVLGIQSWGKSTSP